MLVASYNPGYQNILKKLKPSTRQRFVAIGFDFPDPATETAVVAAESGLDAGPRRGARPPRRAHPQALGHGPRGGRLHAPPRLRRRR